MAEYMSKNIIDGEYIIIKGEKFKLVDDLDYGYILELTQKRKEAIENKVEREVYFRDILPLSVKIIIPECSPHIKIDTKQHLFQFKEKRFGYCELEELNAALIEAESLILKKRLPYLYKQIEANAPAEKAPVPEEDEKKNQE